MMAIDRGKFIITINPYLAVVVVLAPLLVGAYLLVRFAEADKILQKRLAKPDHELDESSIVAYFEKHPDALEIAFSGALFYSMVFTFLFIFFFNEFLTTASRGRLFMAIMLFAISLLMWARTIDYRNPEAFKRRRFSGWMDRGIFSQIVRKLYKSKLE
jgi:hypothetical protein